MPNDEPWVMDFSKMEDGPPPPQLFGYDTGTGPPWRWGNKEDEYYTKSSRNASVEDCELVVRALPQHRGGMPFTSARLDTEGHFGFTFGRLELDIKWSEGMGPWGAAWLLSNDKESELDIAEYWSRWPNAVQASIHTTEQGNDPYGGSKNAPGVTNATTQYHRYGIIKGRNHIEYTYDGLGYFGKDRPGIGGKADRPYDPNEKWHLLLNLAMGGTGNEPVDVASGPWEMRVRRIAFTPLDTAA